MLHVCILPLRSISVNIRLDVVLFVCYYLLAYVGMLGGLYVYYYFIITY